MTRHLRAARARLAGVFGKDRGDADLREELESHIEMETAENIRRGMAPEEARRQALLAAGGVTQAAEAVRDRRGLPWLENFAADVRYAFRVLRKSPGFTAVVVVTLGLGIGANTAIFSVVRGVLLRPLPHAEGDRLVYLRQSAEGPSGANINFSVPEVRDLRNGVPSLAGVAEYSPWSLVHQSAEGAERIQVGLITGNYFEVMGLSPILGRVTEPGDDGAGVPPVAVLTHEFWMRRFGGDPSVVGTEVRLDGQPVTVIGVLEPAPFYPQPIDAVLNMAISDHHVSAMMVEGRSHRMTSVVARLAPGATLERVRSEVAAVYERLQTEYPEAYDVNSNYRLTVIPFRDVMSEHARATLRVLMAAAAFVLVIAASNVANLTLMRGVRREQELVLRTALGAGTARLRRLLLAENLVLALLGCALGVAIALAGVRLLTAFAARYSPLAEGIRVDGGVLAFALGISVLLALLLSLIGGLPREGTLAARIAAGVRRMSASAGKQRVQRGLVVVQIALSVVLLGGAGLLTRTMLRLSAVDTGLLTEEVLTMRVSLLTPQQLLTDPAAEAAAKERYEEMRREIAALPGVIEVGLGSTAPLRRSDAVFDVKAEARPLASGEAQPRAEFRTANPEFFRASGIPLLAGRDFASTDSKGAGQVAIINQILAERLFRDEDPIGRQIAFTGEMLRFAPISGDWRTVVGVVGDTRDAGLDADPTPAVYLPFDQAIAIAGSFAIRTEGDAASLIPAATRIVRRLASTAPIEHVMTVAQHKASAISPHRLNAGLIGSFGLLALFIAAVGIAGVLGFSVSTRIQEIGIRMSLGADGGQVQRMILVEGGVLVALGLALGTVCALLGGRLIEGLLFGVEPHDPITLSLVGLLMATVGIVACWIPALRAARVEPATAMRAA